MLLSKAMESFVEYLILIDRAPKTIIGYKTQMEYLEEFLNVRHNGPIYLEDIELEDLEAYLSLLKEREIATSSRNRMVYVLRSFYSFCCKKDLCEKNIALLLEPVRIVQEERTYITEEEFTQLAKAIDQKIVRTLVQTMFYTGARMTEMINLKLKDVDMEKGILHIIEGKGRKNRKIPINDKLNAILKNYLKNIRKPLVPSDRFFATDSTGKISAATINTNIYKATAALGWEKHISSHILRHSFSTNLLNKGASVVSIQKLLGHASLTVTSRYLHQSMDTLTETVNLF